MVVHGGNLVVYLGSFGRLPWSFWSFTLVILVVYLGHFGRMNPQNGKACLILFSIALPTWGRFTCTQNRAG